MPPRIGAFANVENLRQFAEQARANPQKALNTSLRHVSKKPGAAQQTENVMRSIIDSANGERGQALALSALHKALAGSYGEKVADLVFTRMSGKLFSGKATLSANLIDQADRTARKIVGKRPNRANGRNVPPLDDNKVKPDNKVKSGNKREAKGPDNGKAKPNGKQKVKTRDNNPIARIRAIQIKKKIDRKNHLKKRLAAQKRANASPTSPKSNKQLADTNKRMQAKVFFRRMEKDGLNGGPFSFKKLMSAATGTQGVRLNPKDMAAAKDAIRKAFVAYPSTVQLATMNTKQRAENIVIPALRDFFVELRRNESTDT